MSSLDLEFDLDARLSTLEQEWLRAFEASFAAREDCRVLAAAAHADLDSVDRAHDRLECSEALKIQIMAKIDRLEQRVAART